VVANSLNAVLTRNDGPWVETRAELLAFVDRRVANRETSEDIVHDLLERLHHADPATISNLQAWLYRSARNAVIDHYRKRGAVPVDVVDDDLAGFDDGPSGNEPVAAVQELARCLRPLVDLLPDEYRDAITLVDLDGHTHHAAAQLAGVSTSGMKSRVQRGRKKLGALLHDCCVIETSGGAIDDYAPRDESCPCATSGKPIAVAE
jgi:RNA polymerase sigma-70 factor (ECF subfamily)